MKKQNTLIWRLALQIAAGAVLLAVVESLIMVYIRPQSSGRALFGSLLVIGVFAIWLTWWLRQKIHVPLEDLYFALRDEGMGMTPELLSREDDIGALAEAASDLIYQVEEELGEACRRSAAKAEQQAQTSMAEEICRSALPQRLPDIPSRSNFELDGFIERGLAQNSQFYDYFFIDPGLLCVVIAQTPGGGIAEALYMVVAQTTIRSRLRQGRSLEETMADVNTQLYDLGSRSCLNALVGTLNTADGRFTYVNAGQQQPLFMRNEDRYEWVESPVYAPLGMNENVSYRSMELRMKQGDRLFLHTAGLSSLEDAQGTAYGVRQMRADLNTSRSKGLSGQELLQFVSDNAIVYSQDMQAKDGYALLMLLFCKGDKELAHCDVPARPEYAAEVAGFLKKQFADNGIDRRHYAREAVLVDEMFALCCRKAQAGSNVMVECGVAPDAQMVNIRITAVLGGIDPLETENGTAENAVDFIRDNADYVTFKAGEERDTITMVSFL